MPNTEKKCSNWKSLRAGGGKIGTTAGGETGTTTAENYLAVPTLKLNRGMHDLAIPFPVFPQQKGIYMLTKRHNTRMFKSALFKIALNIYL